jgi:hypothetical protein
MNFFQSLFHRPFFIRLLNWEYWSFAAVYTWIYPIWFLLCLRARSFFFFAAANPRIRNGGFLNESKEEMVPMIPEALHPRTAFFTLPCNADIVLAELERKGLHYPLMGKPNVGGRGRGVKVLASDEDVRSYVQTAFLDFHIQEYVPYKNEVGIFYCRYPDQQRGYITGIVEKKFMSVTGDGVHNIRQLLLKNKRALMYMESYENIHGETLDTVLPAGEKRVISPFGNHSRGALFLDISDRIDDMLNETIDAICRQIPDFYYGRLDIRYQSWDKLRAGKHFAIIEVNGAGSEPTHIYDPKHSLFFAWKEIVRHWIILNRISRQNKKKGHPYLSLREGIDMFRENKALSEKLAAMTD